MINRITGLFPLWALVFSVSACFYPHLWQPLKPSIIPLLGLIMLGMGLTLTVADFKNVLRSPKPLFIGVCLQFLLMPLIAYAISHVAHLSPALLTGMVLVGSAPGGTASNVICYLAKADVALSISLTLISTLLSFVITPLLIWVAIGQTIEVQVVPMLITILKIIIVPVVLGVTINTFFGRRLTKIKNIFPLISVAAIVVIIAIVVALSHDSIVKVGYTVVLCVMAHNILGVSAGYSLARLFKLDKTKARTIAIEVGMQNSGLSVALALKYFSNLAALPGAVFSIWHNLSGACLAQYWANKSDHAPQHRVLQQT